jgi:hypothetical protein
MHRHVSVGPEGIVVQGFSLKKTLLLLKVLVALDAQAVSEMQIGFQAPSKEVPDEKAK